MLETSQLKNVRVLVRWPGRGPRLGVVVRLGERHGKPAALVRAFGSTRWFAVDELQALPIEEAPCNE